MFWGLIKRLQPKKDSVKVAAVLNKMGKLVTSPAERRKAWADFYQKLGTAATHPDPARFDDTFKAQVEAEIQIYAKRSRGEPETELDQPFTCEELDAKLKRLPNNKATGVDGIPNELLKYGGPAMARPYKTFLNGLKWLRRSLRNGARV